MTAQDAYVGNLVSQMIEIQASLPRTVDEDEAFIEYGLGTATLPFVPYLGGLANGHCPDFADTGPRRLFRKEGFYSDDLGWIDGVQFTLSTGL